MVKHSLAEGSGVAGLARDKAPTSEVQEEGWGGGGGREVEAGDDWALERGLWARPGTGGATSTGTAKWLGSVEWAAYCLCRAWRWR